MISIEPLIKIGNNHYNFIISRNASYMKFIWFQKTPWGYEKQYIYTLQYQMEKKLSNKYYE